LLHAELQQLTRIDDLHTLRASVIDAGGEESWGELEKRLWDAKRSLREATGVGAAICLLTVLYTLHRMSKKGYRGLIGSAECIAKRIEELLGGMRGMSVRTLMGAGRILERAGLIDRWVYGRGKLVEVPDQTDPLPDQAPGEERRFRRVVSAYTLTAAAVGYWSAPPRRRRATAPVGVKTTSASLADNSLLGSGFASLSLSPPGSARASISSAPSPARLSHAVSAEAADEFERAATAAASMIGGSASPVPGRRFTWRPEPPEPNDLAHARQALLYDLETVLLRHRRRDRGRVLALVDAELAPARFMDAVMARLTGVPPPRGRGSGLEKFFGQWLWHWRDLPLETRQLVCTRMILPAALAHLRRVELWCMPQLEEVTADGEIVAAHISRARCTARAPDPGPRMYAPAPRAPERARAVEVAPAPRTVGPGEMWCTGPPRSPPAPEHDDAWLKDLQRRRGGEEV
jgi:hypothetical protein